MLQDVKKAVHAAGEQILSVYHSNELGVEYKDDNSPLTRADQLAHYVLADALNALNCGPVLSEEDANIPWATRQNWEQYWLVDPLDGTKEFIKHNGEFTVNVALIRKGRPVMGVVYAPVLDLWYWGAEGEGAFRQKGNAAPQPIHPAAAPAPGEPWRVVGSRSHKSAEFESFMRGFENSELVSVGSSLKLCMVADGQAHLYPRLIPTCEWDTAAGQAVAEAAGAAVLEWGSWEPLRCNQKDSLLNPFFVVCANKTVLQNLPDADAG